MTDPGTSPGQVADQGNTRGPGRVGAGMDDSRRHYQCQNPGCPRRAPQCLTEPPVCYTCGERMPAVEMRSCSECRLGWGPPPLSGKAKVVADHFASLPSPFWNPIPPPSELMRSIPHVYIEGQLDGICSQQDPDKAIGAALRTLCQLTSTVAPVTIRTTLREEDRLAAVWSAAARQRSRSQNKP